MLNDDNILRSSPPGDLEFDKQKGVDGCMGLIKCEFSLLYAYVLHILGFFLKFYVNVQRS